MLTKLTFQFIYCYLFVDGNNSGNVEEKEEDPVGMSTEDNDHFVEGSEFIGFEKSKNRKVAGIELFYAYP